MMYDSRRHCVCSSLIYQPEVDFWKTQRRTPELQPAASGQGRSRRADPRRYSYGGISKATHDAGRKSIDEFAGQGDESAGATTFFGPHNDMEFSGERSESAATTGYAAPLR